MELSRATGYLGIGVLASVCDGKARARLCLLSHCSASNLRAPTLFLYGKRKGGGFSQSGRASIAAAGADSRYRLPFVVFNSAPPCEQKIKSAPLKISKARPFNNISLSVLRTAGSAFARSGLRLRSAFPAQCGGYSLLSISLQSSSAEGMILSNTTSLLMSIVGSVETPSFCVRRMPATLLIRDSLHMSLSPYLS